MASMLRGLLNEKFASPPKSDEFADAHLEAFAGNNVETIDSLKRQLRSERQETQRLKDMLVQMGMSTKNS